jgi:hypothetical protein
MRHEHHASPGHVALVTRQLGRDALLQDAGASHGHVSRQRVVTTVADYMHFVLGGPRTRAIGLALERCATPRASARARAPGATSPSCAQTGAPHAAPALAHSVALAGEDAAYERLRAIRRASRPLDRRALDTLELFGTCAARRTGSRCSTPEAALAAGRPREARRASRRSGRRGCKVLGPGRPTNRSMLGHRKRRGDLRQPAGARRRPHDLCLFASTSTIDDRDRYPGSPRGEKTSRPGG